MTKKNIIITLVTVALIGGIVLGVKAYKGIATEGNSSTSSNTITSNVVVANGSQEITITAGQGYSPKITTAKAGMATTLKIQGKNAYGCESGVRIPKLSYAKNLDPNGADSMKIEAQTKGSVINGTCAMGMYNFQIKFE